MEKIFDAIKKIDYDKNSIFNDIELKNHIISIVEMTSNFAIGNYLNIKYLDNMKNEILLLTRKIYEYCLTHYIKFDELEFQKNNFKSLINLDIIAIEMINNIVIVNSFFNTKDKRNVISSLQKVYYGLLQYYKLYNL